MIDIAAHVRTRRRASRLAAGQLPPLEDLQVDGWLARRPDKEVLAAHWSPTDPGQPRFIAVKLFHGLLARRVARALGLLWSKLESFASSGVIRPLRKGQSAGTFHVVEPLIEHDLGDLPAPLVPHSGALLTQTARVLAELHAVGVSHGNLKPSNILVATGAAGPLAWLTDFDAEAVSGSAELADARAWGGLCTALWPDAPDAVVAWTKRLYGEVGACQAPMTELVQILQDFGLRNEPQQAAHQLAQVGLEVVGVAGRGASACVYHVRAGGRDLAAKLFAPGEGPARAERIRSVLDLLRSFRNAPFVIPEAIGEVPSGQTYYTMELFPETLRRAAARLDLIARLDALCEVSRALGQLHRLGIVHRDLKPSNVLVKDIRGRTKVVVADFGLAVTAFAPASSGPVGTPRFWPPEAMDQDHRVSPAWDVWSWAATSIAVLAANSDGARLPPTADPRTAVDKLESVPQPVVRLLKNALHPDPTRRPDANEVTAILAGELTWLRSRHTAVVVGDGLPQWLAVEEPRRLFVESVRTRTREWLEADRAPHLLWSGRRLRDKEKQRKAVRAALAGEEQEFWAASVALDRATRRRRRWLGAVAAVLLVALAAGAARLVAVSKRDQKLRQQQQRAVTLAQQADAAFPDNPSQAVELAWRSLITSDTVVGRQAAARLADELSGFHGMHTVERAVVHLAVSPNGEHMASANDACEVALWPLSGGTPRFVTQLHRIRRLTFTQDSQWLRWEDRSGQLWRWNTANAEVPPSPIEEAWVAIGAGPVTGAQPWQLLLDDERGLVLVGPSADLVRVLQPGPHNVISVAHDPRGRFIGTGHRDGRVRLWHVPESAAHLAARLKRWRDGRLTWQRASEPTPHGNSVARLTHGWLSLTLVQVPPGNTPDRFEDTTPSDLWLGQTEATQRQYEALVHRNPSSFFDPEFPVTNVSWDEAVMFCERLRAVTALPFRLPIEHEWMAGGWAGADTRYPWGDELDAICEYGNVLDAGSNPEPRPANAASCADGARDVALVGTYRPNRLGLYDMIGNATELTIPAARAHLAQTRSHWRGTGADVLLTLRGSSHADDPRVSASARYTRPVSGNDDAGFRLALTARALATQGQQRGATIAAPLALFPSDSPHHTTLVLAANEQFPSAYHSRIHKRILVEAVPPDPALHYRVECREGYLRYLRIYVRGKRVLTRVVGGREQGSVRLARHLHGEGPASIIFEIHAGDQEPWHLKTATLTFTAGRVRPLAPDDPATETGFTASFGGKPPGGR